MITDKPHDLTAADFGRGLTGSPHALPSAGRGKPLLRWTLTLGLATLVIAALFIDTLTAGVGCAYLLQRLQTFVTVFLGIFIEAAPFLLAGSLVLGFIAVFVAESFLERYRSEL